ncbi:HD domain-containing protein [Candidatus Woesearchaeota archaeon]|nr:HD domain-containing protein [Candidatus Woesearchaeota archaeon]
MDDNTESAIRKKLREAGIGTFIDVHVKLFDDFAESFAAINSGFKPKQVLGAYLALVYQAISYIDNQKKLGAYLRNVGPILSNIVGNEFGFSSYHQLLSEGDEEFLNRIVKYHQVSKREDYIRGMESVILAADESRRITDMENVATSAHCKRVAKYAVKLCKTIGVDSNQTKQIEESADLHDVGKIVMPKEVYENRLLTQDEKKLMQRHPLIGYFILRKNGNGHLADGSRFHHERWDGTGYPDGKKGKDIPFSATIISVADAYDAMTHRPWRGKTPEQALDEIVKQSGKQFHPDIAKKEVVEYLLAA